MLAIEFDEVIVGLAADHDQVGLTSVAETVLGGNAIIWPNRLARIIQYSTFNFGVIKLFTYLDPA